MTFEEWVVGEKKESEERILELVKALLQDKPSGGIITDQ